MGKYFSAEVPADGQRRILTGEFVNSVTSEDIADITFKRVAVKNVMNLLELMDQHGRTVVVPICDQNFCSEGVAYLNVDNFIMFKVLDESHDKELIKKYEDIIQQYRLKRAGIVKAENQGSGIIL